LSVVALASDHKISDLLRNPRALLRDIAQAIDSGAGIPASRGCDYVRPRGRMSPL